MSDSSEQPAITKKRRGPIEPESWKKRVDAVRLQHPHWIADVGHDLQLHVDWEVRAVPHSNGRHEVVVQINDDGTYTTKRKPVPEHHRIIFEHLLAMDEDTYKKKFCRKDESGEWHYRLSPACMKCGNTDMLLPDFQYYDFIADLVTDEGSCVYHRISNVSMILMCLMCKHTTKLKGCMCGIAAPVPLQQPEQEIIASYLESIGRMYQQQKETEEKRLELLRNAFPNQLVTHGQETGEEDEEQEKDEENP